MPYPNLYHGESVASGLAFVPKNKEYVPPSLRMIRDNVISTCYESPQNFLPKLDMETWVKQGVFLLNSALTVEHGKAGSHVKNWEYFTTEVIKTISESTSGVIFCLWGKEAQKFSPIVNKRLHYVLTAPHPVSAVYRGGVWECDHFRRINEILTATNGDRIQWLTRVQ